jgi:pimeloyl-ACP methyl ester carboxylesterase
MSMFIVTSPILILADMRTITSNPTQQRAAEILTRGSGNARSDDGGAMTIIRWRVVGLVIRRGTYSSLKWCTIQEATVSTESIYKSPAGERAIMAWYDAMLARWPAPHTMLDVPTRYGNTFVITSGNESAPPLILLHGAGSNSAMWVGDAYEYSRRYRVYAVDLLGEPGKSAPVRPEWNSPAYAEWLGEVLDALRVERAILVGLSQGGWTALKFATSRPERVNKLVLLTPGGITPDRLSFALRAIPLSFLGRWGIERINRLIFGHQPMPEEVNEAMTLIMTQFKPRIGVLPIFTDEELRRLTMPTLLLIGDEDALRDARKIIERMERLVPELKAIIIPQAGHALVNTTGAIMPFLAADERA